MKYMLQVRFNGATRIPVVRMGGTVEVRTMVQRSFARIAPIVASTAEAISRRLGYAPR